jgi:hypothetical protein
MEELHRAWAYASLCPYKDMEMVVMGSSMTCPAFQRLLHACLRTLIDELGCRTFNVGILNITLDESSRKDGEQEPDIGSSVWGDEQSRDGQGSDSSKSESCSSVGGSSGYSSDRDTSSDSDLGALTSQSVASSEDGSQRRYKVRVQKGAAAAASGIPKAFRRAPVMARVVSRGKLTSAASDFGCLEVFGGASIGHTDPYKVLECFDLYVANAYD